MDGWAVLSLRAFGYGVEWNFIINWIVISFNNRGVKWLLPKRDKCRWRFQERWKSEKQKIGRKLGFKFNKKMSCNTLGFDPVGNEKPWNLFLLKRFIKIMNFKNFWQFFKLTGSFFFSLGACLSPSLSLSHSLQCDKLCVIKTFLI